MDYDTEKAVDEAEINENDLQYEWSVQPVIFLEASLRVSQLIHKRDSLKSQKTSQIIADNSGQKLTDAFLKRTLESDQELIDLDFEISNYKASVSALAQKKTSLENLTTLLINNLNAEPKTPEEKEAIKESIKKGLRNAQEKD